MKMQRKKERSIKINTTALPDIIFMLLFFFMVTTVMQTKTIKELSLPQSYGSTQQGEPNPEELNIYLYAEDGAQLITVNDQKQSVEQSKLLITGIANQKSNEGIHIQKANLYIDANIVMSSVNQIKETLQELDIYKVKLIHEYGVM
jgi:biopolymer transport protein ExbD